MSAEDTSSAGPDDPERRIVADLVRYQRSLGHGPVHCEITDRSTQRWSETLQIRIDTATGTEDVFVKRVTGRAQQRAAATSDRPRLKPFVGFDDRTRREAAALRSIQAMVEASGDERWFSVAVLPVPTDAETMFLEHVPHPTLADLLRGRRGPADDERLVAACRAAGAWLRALHQMPDGDQQGARLGSGSELAAVVGNLLDHVTSHVDGEAARLGPLLHRALDRVPATLPLLPCHADFAAHNIFVDEAGAVAVFDTALDWRMPPHYDLAYFSVMLDFADLRRITPRLRARGAGGLRAALFDGYGESVPPEPERRAFEIAVLVEKWASLSEGRRGSVMRRVAKAARSELMQRRLRRVLEGLLAH